MRKILSLSVLGLKQVRRQKLFVAMVFFFILYLGFCLFLGKLSVAHADKVLRDTGLMGIEISLVILSIFGLSLDFARERSTHTLDIYLLHLGRSAYLATKMLSYILASCLYLVISGLALSIFLLLYRSFTPAIFGALYSLLLKITLVIAFTSLFAVIFSSPLLAMSAALFIYIGAELLPSAWEIMSRTPNVYERGVIYTIYAIFPNFSRLDFRYLAVWGNFPSGTQIVQVTIYTLAYLVCVYLLNTIVLGKKEL